MLEFRNIFQSYQNPILVLQPLRLKTISHAFRVNMGHNNAGSELSGHLSETETI